MTFNALVIVTTSVGPTADLEERAQQAAANLCSRYVPRRNAALPRLIREAAAERLLIVTRDRMLLHDSETGIEYAFHPNLVPVRAYNRAHGGNDMFGEATGLAKGDSLLDCTLGFAAEATLGAMMVGPEGRIVGLESVPELALVTREGLANLSIAAPAVNDAMRRIEVVTADYRDYLSGCATRSFDVVYFDPFFGERLPGSENSVTPLAFFGDPRPLDTGAALEAQRVARRRVVVKHPRHEPLSEELAGAVTGVVSARRSRIVYSIFSREHENGRRAHGKP